MIYHNIINHTRVYSSLTIANVALLSVSKRSDVASMLACSISRRFFFMFSRCMSAALSALCGINNEVEIRAVKNIKKKPKRQKNLCVPSNIFFRFNTHKCFSFLCCFWRESSFVRFKFPRTRRFNAVMGKRNQMAEKHKNIFRFIKVYQISRIVLEKQHLWKKGHTSYEHCVSGFCYFCNYIKFHFYAN